MLDALEPRTLLASVAVNFNDLRQTITGLGGNAARVVWAKPGDEAATDSHGQFALDNLQDTVVRVGIPWKQWEPVNDDASPASVNPAGFKDEARVRSAFEFLQQLKARGSTIIASAWEAPAWLWTTATNPLGGPSHTIADAMYAEAAESLTQYLVRARDVYGVTVPYVSFNESNFGIQIFMAADRMARFVETTGKAFSAAGLPTKWMLGDTFSTETLPEYATPIFNYAPARPYLGPISYHSWWSEDDPDSFFTRIAALGKQFGKEVWSPEVGYDATAGKNQAQFATWNNAFRLARIYNRVIKLSEATVALYWEYGRVGGNSVDDFPITDDALNPYPSYYVLKQLNDNLPKGAKVVGITSNDAGILTLAAKDPATNNYFVQLINNTGAANTTTVTGLPAANYAARRSSTTENDRQIATFQPSGGSYTISLPANSVTVLTTRGQPPITQTQTPWAGINFPATIQAENYDRGGQGVAFNDTEAANLGGAYRNDGADVEAISGGFALDYTKAGEWAEYTVNVPQAGTYDLSVRYASLRGGGRFHLDVDGKAVTPSLTASSSGAWATYRTINSGPITLSAGQHVLRLAMDANDSTGFVANFDSLTFTQSTGAVPTPFKGTPFNVNETIQAEDYDVGGQGVSWSDTTSANEGNAYRTNKPVDVEPTTDTGGGFNVGWVRQGEWLGYTVNVAQSGNYVVDARVAALAAGGVFHIEFNGQNKTGAVAVPQTGAWQSWRTITTPTFALNAGTYFMKIAIDKVAANGFAGNFNWFKLRKV